MTRGLSIPGRRSILAAALLLAALVVAYVPAIQGGFVWDDQDYVVQNENLRSLAGLGRLWTDPHSLPQYYPLVATSFWLEYRLWELEPAGYHLVNVLLHGIASILFWRVLVVLGVRGAWVAAAVFALHPVNVESVAWITERKNTLSAVFFLATALVYLRYALSEGPRSVRRERLLYVGSLVLFTAALLSKTTASTLPPAILVIVWWKRGRITLGDVVPLLPLFLAAVVLGLNTAQLERTHVGAIGPEWDFSLADRWLIAGRAVWFYLGKLAFPHPQMFFYPRWEVDAGVWWQHLFPLTAVGLVVLLWALRGRIGRGPLAALLFFGGTLFPALGFFDTYFMRYSFVADHWQYLACMGPIALVVSAAALALDRLGGRRLQVAAAGAVLGGFGVLTWQQAGIYRDEETLWREAIASNPAAWAAHANLGLIHIAAGRFEDALESHAQALEHNPDDSALQFNYGWTLHLIGRSRDALPYLNRSLPNERLHNPQRVLYVLSQAWSAVGDFPRSLRYLQEAVRAPVQAYMKGTDAVAIAAPYNDLAWVRAAHPAGRFRNGREAVRLAERACSLTKFQNPLMLDTLAAAYAETGDFERALRTQREAIALGGAQGLAEALPAFEQRLAGYGYGRPVRDRETFGRPRTPAREGSRLPEIPE